MMKASVRRSWAVVLLLAAATLSAAEDQLPTPPLYELVPADREYAIARVCSTSEGLCALPLYHPPGAPCTCRRADGTEVQGVCTH